MAMRMREGREEKKKKRKHVEHIWIYIPSLSFI